MYIGALEERFLCSSFRLLLHAFSSLAADRCCLEPKVSGTGVSADSLISAPRRVMGSAPRMDVACPLRRSWRLSHLPTSLGSHWSSLPSSATACTHCTSMALKLSRTTPYVLVKVWSLASATLAFFMHQVWCSLNNGCTSIKMPSECVTCALNCRDPFLTIIFADSFRRMCWLWPCLRLNSATSVFAVSNCSPHQLAHSMLFAVHLSSIEMTWLTTLPVTTQPRSSTHDSTSASDTYSSTNLIIPKL